MVFPVPGLPRLQARNQACGEPNCWYRVSTPPRLGARPPPPPPSPPSAPRRQEGAESVSDAALASSPPPAIAPGRRPYLCLRPALISASVVLGSDPAPPLTLGYSVVCADQGVRTVKVSILSILFPICLCKMLSQEPSNTTNTIFQYAYVLHKFSIVYWSLLTRTSFPLLSNPC